MINVKRVTAAMFLVTFFMPSVIVCSQTSDIVLSDKWDFASAKTVEKNRKTGKIYADKMFHSVSEIDNKVYFFEVPVSIEFTGESGELASVEQKQGSIRNARVIYKGETLFLLQAAGRAELSQEEILAANPADLYVTAQYGNTRLSGGVLSLQYSYVYMVGDNDIIDGVMTINFNPGQNADVMENVATQANDAAPQTPDAGEVTTPQEQNSNSSFNRNDKDKNSLLNFLEMRKRAVNAE